MQKLILQYYWDDGAYSGHEHFPFEYSSKEQAFVDFFTGYESGEPFHFLGREYQKSMWCNCPEILTLEEWFENNKLK